jgi:hypothetical protein
VATPVPDAAWLARRRRNRAALLLLLALGFAPLLAALLMRQVSVEGTFAGTNAGVLLRPPLPLAALVEGSATRAGRWQVILAGSPCVEACAAARQRLDALPTLLGRDSNRVRFEHVPAFIDPAAAAYAEGALVADPLGNVILYYRYEQVGAELLDDLKHLLKFSSTG